MLGVKTNARNLLEYKYSNVKIGHHVIINWVTGRKLAEQESNDHLEK